MAPVLLHPQALEEFADVLFGDSAILKARLPHRLFLITKTRAGILVDIASDLPPCFRSHQAIALFF